MSEEKSKLEESLTDLAPISEPPLFAREDLDHLFMIDDAPYSPQLSLDIESFEQARANGSFIPKPRQTDVDRRLRAFRRYALKANEFGVISSKDFQDAFLQLAEFLDSGVDETLITELKKFLYVVMPDKVYAESIDGSVHKLLTCAIRQNHETMPISWTAYLRNAEPEDIFLALEEVMEDLDPIGESGIFRSNDPEVMKRVTDRFPHLAKLMYETEQTI